MILKIDKPNEKQKLFLKANKRFVAYGGARGGGKSWAVRIKTSLLGLNYSGIKMLLLRRTYPELKENHIIPLRELLKSDTQEPIATYKETDKAFTFINGSRLKLGYLDTENDVLQYQGQEYDIIFIDEATQFTEFQFNILKACLRGANSFPKRMYLTCNPGGIGHSWVKRLFIDRDFTVDENPDNYEFIQALVYDNEALLKADKEYVKMLESLPTELREAWLYGKWDVFNGQYFREFDRAVHTCEPYEIDKSFKRYRVLDYGLDMLACYWIAVDNYGKAIIYKELYKSGLIVSEAARMIKEYTSEDIYLTLAPPDLWNRNRDTGKSTAEIFNDNGILLTQAKNERIQGWLNVKEWLKVYEDEQKTKTSNIKIFRTCVNLIRCVGLIQYDTKNVNDVATEPHELTHSVDALRYFCAGRPSPTVIKDTTPKHYDFEIFKPHQDPLGRGAKVRVI